MSRCDVAAPSFLTVGAGRTVGSVLVVAAISAVTAMGCAGPQRSPPTCPHAAVLTDASTLTRFVDRERTDRLDIDFEVEMVDLRSGCQFEEVKDGIRLTVAVQPLMVVSRGPANDNSRAGFSYFVSVIGPDQEILAKADFPVDVRFEGNQRQAVIQEDPPVTIDMPLSRETEALSFEVILGLQLTAEELAYNRQRQIGRP